MEDIIYTPQLMLGSSTVIPSIHYKTRNLIRNGDTIKPWIRWFSSFAAFLLLNNLHLWPCSVWPRPWPGPSHTNRAVAFSCIMNVKMVWRIISLSIRTVILLFISIRFLFIVMLMTSNCPYLQNQRSLMAFLFLEIVSLMLSFGRLKIL